jgi:hypothetical protein
MRRLLPVLVALLLALPAFASQAIATSVEGLARTSDLVVRGKVVSAVARWTEGRIYTYAEIQVAGSLRGTAPARLTAVTPGGVVGDLGQRVDGAAVFVPGEEVVLFLGRPQGGLYRVSGLGQGKFTVEGKGARPDTARIDFVATEVPAGERRAEPMPVAELERRVRSVR